MQTANESDKKTIAGKIIVPWEAYRKSKNFNLQPLNFKPERTTVWSFKERGDWASHTPQYRGNWSPYVVRNILELYSHPGDLILDPMVGGGTTPVECLLTGRNSISFDINPLSIDIVKDRLKIPNIENELPKTSHQVSTGDARNLSMIKDESIDLIATHPPYANIIKYSESIDGDLSRMDTNEFFKEFHKAIKEYLRVLKNGKYCAILVGDTHYKGHYVPLANRMMLQFLDAGFLLKEDVIKVEWNCQSDFYLYWYRNNNFLLTAHEHLYIFKKVNADERSKYINSSIDYFRKI